MEFLGLRLSDVVDILNKQNRRYVIVKTFALKPLENADDTRVIRVRNCNDLVEITVSEFKTSV